MLKADVHYGIIFESSPEVNVCAFILYIIQVLLNLAEFPSSKNRVYF